MTKGELRLAQLLHGIAFDAGARVFAVVEMNDGSHHEVHKDCARRIETAHEGAIVDETTSAAQEQAVKS